MHSLYYYSIPVVVNTTITIQQNVKVKSFSKINKYTIKPSSFLGYIFRH